MLRMAKRGGERVPWTRNWWLLGGIGIVVVLMLGVGYAVTASTTRETPDYVSTYVPDPNAGADIPTKLTIPENSRVLFIGDSFTEGHGADDKKTRGFAPRLAALEGWTDYRVDGVGRTGFVRPGATEDAHRTYGERLQQLYESGSYSPNLIIFQGGLNDSTKAIDTRTLQRAVQDTLAMAKGFWPDASMVVIGPMTYRTSLNPVNSAYSQGSYVARVPYIDFNRYPVISKEDNVKFTIDDGFHPNDIGHQMVADALKAKLDEMTGAAAN